MPMNIFDECKEEHADCIDLSAQELEELTAEEIVDSVWEEHPEEEIYRVRVLKNPRQGRKEIVFPREGFIRYIPRVEIQFWSFPGDEKSSLSLRDLLWARAQEYSEGNIEDDVWQLMAWTQEDTAEEGEEVINYDNSGMMIRLWFGSEPRKGMVMQVMGAG